jgi:glycosyltransferase involved in cell wall biosynthesis
LKLFDYMASGTPIIASDLPSLGEVLRDESNALLVPPGDAEAFARALRRLADGPALGARLSGQAKQESGAYAWELRAQRIIDFIREQIELTP